MRKSRKIPFRVSKQEYSFIKRAADGEGKSISEYIRDKLLSDAPRNTIHYDSDLKGVFNKRKL